MKPSPGESRHPITPAPAARFSTRYSRRASAAHCTGPAPVSYNAGRAMSSVCVFCGSLNSVSDLFLDAARETGRLFAASGWTIVYGGARTG